MKTLLAISLAANCLLAGALLRFGGAGAVSSARNTPVVASKSQPSSPRASPGGEPFRWSRLESSDYCTYIANLRGIGCPEQTLRDLITADVHALYEGRREALRRQARGAAASVPEMAGQSLETRLRRLESEEKDLVASLLGPSPSIEGVRSPDEFAAGDAASAPRVRDRRSAAPLPKPAVAIPVAWAAGAPGASPLTDQETEAVKSVRQVFQQEMAAASGDTSDPAYRQAWLRAQIAADDALAARLGQVRFDELRSGGQSPEGNAPR